MICYSEVSVVVLPIYLPQDERSGLYTHAACINMGIKRKKKGVATFFLIEN